MDFQDIKKLVEAEISEEECLSCYRFPGRGGDGFIIVSKREHKLFPFLVRGFKLTEGKLIFYNKNENFVACDTFRSAQAQIFKIKLLTGI